jgi:hypothetical protein
MHGSPPYSSASRAIQEAPHHDLFTNTTALTEALYARFQAFAFHSRAHHAHAHAQGPLFAFRGACACDPLGFDRRGQRASARDVAHAVRAEIAARCALLFHAALPAAMIPAGVLVRSVCHVRRRPPRNGSVRSLRGILDVSVVEADEKGRYTILVGFRVLG